MPNPNDMSNVDKVLQEVYKPALENSLKEPLHFQSSYPYIKTKFTRRIRLYYWCKRLQPVLRTKMAYRAFKDPDSGYWD